VAEVVDLRLGLNNGKAHDGQLEFGSKPAGYSKRQQDCHTLVFLRKINNTLIIFIIVYNFFHDEFKNNKV